ncbi:ATP-binding cassette domain-containing protein [Kineococcus xinjiangensis]|uniref:ATP-binding cassette domain-containing protein n=1 Tax=Kineococcus xinjiangensis TaxID=512762 RepID=UPI000CECCE33|nr:ABC transporter ATP-binding protein [Kineococcus xinjiangensis]
MRARAGLPGRRRLRNRGAAAVAVLAVAAAAAETAGAVVAGRLATGPGWAPVGVLAALLVGAALADTAGRAVLAGVVGRAERALRADLLDAAVHQPLSVLHEQAVGEVLDRVDDDPAQVANLARGAGWELARALLRAVLAWVVAGLTWWVAWVAFPLAAAAALLVARPLTPAVAARKEAEEAAWSRHAAQLEEAVAGRDDVRSSLGQPLVVRQYAELARGVLDRVRATCAASTVVALRTGLVLHGLLAGLVLAGVWLVGAGGLRLEELLVLWLLASSFIGQLSGVTHRLPELQSGLGALARVRQLLGAEREDTAGEPLPAGTTCALVGRSGAGKSTLVRFLSRAVQPPPGTVLLAGRDVTGVALEDLRRAVGVVTQRTELLSATLAENITLFADVPRAQVERALDALGLGSWAASLPAGLDTRLGVGGTTLSAGEEQLVAFARLLVRDVAVVVLDEATARMDPQTEQRVTRAAQRLLAGRTGLVIAHRLSTTRRCDAVAVLDGGRLVQHGPRAQVASQPGPFRDLLRAAGPDASLDGVEGLDGVGGEPAQGPAGRGEVPGAAVLVRSVRRRERSSAQPLRPSLARSVLRLLAAHPQWGLLGAVGFLATALFSSHGVLTGWLWGRLVAGLDAGEEPWLPAGLLAAGLLAVSAATAFAFRVYPLWWVACLLRMRLNVLRGQTMQRRLRRTPPGEVVARALDSERLVLYADRWVDVVMGALLVAGTALLGGSVLVAVVLGGILVVSALASAAGAPLAGSAARLAGDERAELGRAMASAMEAARTVKLAAATAPVVAHLEVVDARRVAASVREHRVRSLLEGVPEVLCQAGIAAAWSVHVAGVWELQTALLVTTALGGFGWFGAVAGAAVTEAPVARRWLQAASELAGDRDLTVLPAGVDLPRGRAPQPARSARIPLRRLSLEGVAAVHDDGTVGVEDVDLTVERGSLVLLAGRVGSGKSSLLASLAGLVDHEGTLRWNDEEVTDPQVFLRPGQVAYVGQVPRVLSGSFHDNVTLDHAREAAPALATAQLALDVEGAGGPTALVGHRGVRLSGGQVQRLALARALATEAELIVADDVSSALDARTELELWDALRRRGSTVVGSSSKRSALERADVVVVLEDGRVAATGRWSELAGRWGHLAG